LRPPGVPRQTGNTIYGVVGRVKFSGDNKAGRNIVSRKSPVGWVIMRAYNFFVCGPKFTMFLTAIVGGVAVDHLFSKFSLFRSITELFALKVESCRKSSRILDVFALSNFLGGTPSKSCTHIFTPASRHVGW